MREQGAEPGECGGAVVDVDVRGEVAADHEVRAFSAADLFGDHALDDRGVLLVGDVEAVVAERDGGRRQCGEHLGGRQVQVLVDDDAPQRGAVILSDEAAFPHLAVGHHREDLLCGAVDGQRDVGEQLDVDDVPGEQLDRVRSVARDQHEGCRRVCAELGEA